MGNRIEELRQLREFVGQKMREGAAEAPLREVLMREGGWSPDDLNMIFAQVKVAATQSPLVPTTPETPTAPITPPADTTTVTTATTSVGSLSFTVPQSSPEATPATSTPVDATPPIAITTPLAPRADPSELAPSSTTPPPTFTSTQSHLSLLFARLPYLRRILYVFVAGMVLLAGFFGYRIAQWLQPINRDGAVQEVVPEGAGDTPVSPKLEDSSTPSLPETSMEQESATDGTPTDHVNPVPEVVSDADPIIPVSDRSGPAVHTVAISGADTTRTLAPGDKVIVLWEQSGERGEYTTFTLKDAGSNAEYGNAGGGYFASGRVEASAYIPFGAPDGTYHLRVYVRPTNCFPIEFKNVIQGYQPLLASSETNWCPEGSYVVSDSSNTLNLTSQE